MKRPLLVLMLLLSINGLQAQSESKENADRRDATIKQVIQKFQMSIENKDSLMFNSLFLNPKTPFIGIMSKETESSIKKEHPEFQGIAISNSNKFINQICASKNEMMELFKNISIVSDSTIGTVSFDYSFFTSGKIFQWGSETWSVVYFEDQWLITNVTYSIRFPDVEEPPEELKE